MKKLFQICIHRAARTCLSALLYRICARLWEILMRLTSLAKARAIFPGAKNLSLDLRTNIKYPQNISIGHGVIIGPDCVIGAMAPVRIGDLVRISRGVTIESASLDFSMPLPYRHIARPIQIGTGVWLGSGVTVLGGVTIGDYAVIGAGAVVAKNVLSRAVIVGSASRHIRDI